MIDLTSLILELRKPAYAGTPSTDADPGAPALSDAEAAALASQPILTPRPYRITFTSLVNIWGLERAVQFKAALKFMATSGDVSAAATADYAVTVLSADGFDPGHPEAEKAAEMFVAANLCTADEARDSQYVVTYPAGDVVTAADVTAARAAIARADALDAIASRVMGVYAAFENEQVNPAKSDATLRVPTFEDFQALVSAAATGGQ